MYERTHCVYLETCSKDLLPMYSVIRQEFVLPKLLQIYKLVSCNSAIKWVLVFQNNPNDLDLSCKIDLDFGRVFFGGRKTLSNN